jgi:hypothetical protein
MITSLLFCSFLVAFLSTGSVSTANSQVDPTAYANLLALLLTKHGIGITCSETVLAKASTAR